ncbi:30S ribosome-binding factor RbfA [Kiritimatiellota bacterium B12222]|nr:30S ribosome-binding factor RbfA [Kiritimatiellota bacterium B12222]
MTSKRVDRVNELLRHEIANGLYSLQTNPPLDLARVTVSAVDCTSDLRKAKVMISVLEDDEMNTQSENVVRVLNRNRNDFQKLIATNIVLKYTPHLQFISDHGQEHADRIYQILDNLPPMADETPAKEEKQDGAAER